MYAIFAYPATLTQLLILTLTLIRWPSDIVGLPRVTFRCWLLLFMYQSARSRWVAAWWCKTSKPHSVMHWW